MDVCVRLPQREAIIKTQHEPRWRELRSAQVNEESQPQYGQRMTIPKAAIYRHIPYAKTSI